MKYYMRSKIWSYMFIVTGALYSISAVAQFLHEYYGTALLSLLIILLFLFDAYIYRRPYLGLGEGKLIVNVGAFKKEIVLEDVAFYEESNKHIKISYKQGPSTKKLKITLSQLKEEDRKRFVIDLHQVL